jgi:putative FmdB family regulatory protein
MGALSEGAVPIYEYQCPDCGHQFEQLQKISDEPIRTCPRCNEMHVKKLVSQTSFVLKGGGWYKDHYGLKGGGGKSDSGESSSTPVATSSSDKPAAASSDKPAAASTPTESKPAAAPAATSTKTPTV